MVAGPAPDLGAIPGVHDAVVDGTAVHCEVEPAALDAVLRALTGVGVRTLTTQPPTLESLFLKFYGDPAAGSP